MAVFLLSPKYSINSIVLHILSSDKVFFDSYKTIIDIFKYKSVVFRHEITFTVSTFKISNSFRHTKEFGFNLFNQNTFNINEEYSLIFIP